MDTLNPSTQELNWHGSKKIAFRFFSILFVLFITLNNNGAFLYMEKLVYYPIKFSHVLIPWFSKNILHYNYDYTIFTNGSGDTSYDYILLLCMFVLSVIGCIIWSIFDRKRKNYNSAYYWLLLLIRFYLGFTLVLYGAFKIIKLQFPEPSLYRLLQPYGNSSPMGIAWTFLGLSKGYNFFMGIIEVLAALILFRRTMVAGAFLALAASAHVMAMNYFFDIPVKLLSTALVVMCLFILAPYFKSLYTLFIKHETGQLPLLQRPVYKKRWMLITAYTIKYLLIFWTFGVLFNNLIQQSKVYGDAAPKPFLYGIYHVKTFKVNGKDIPPLETDSNRWKQMVINYEGSARIKMMNDSLVNFNTEFRRERHTINLKGQNEKGELFRFTYKIVGKNQLEFSGTRNSDSVQVVFQQKSLKEFKLINRGFRWINEYPYNR